MEVRSMCSRKGMDVCGFGVYDKVEPGDVTKWMAVPWQADFYECNTHWWPAQRPDDVVSEFDFQDVAVKFSVEKGADALATLLFPRKDWARGVDIGRALRPHFEWPTPISGESVSDFAARARTTFIAFTHTNW